MPDFQKLIDGIKAILELIFGKDIPSWIFTALGYILLASLLLIGVWALLAVIAKIVGLWKEKIQPIFYNAEDKRRNIQRQRFARHVEREVQRLNDLEEWRDYKFAELEAEVEAEGRRQVSGLLSFLRRTRSGLRHERSLSKALETSREQHILVEGEPGSGKSVALRHVAENMAHAASQAHSNRAVIPIFVNLKELNRRSDEPVDRNLIQAFVLRVLNRVNDRDIEDFLEKEFDKGMQDGTWLFLFDSFDEIPEVLGSTEADLLIQNYSDAISDFLHGMNQCRGIVASRQFRGPRQSSWPRFRILPLSERRRQELIRKAELAPNVETIVIGQLGTANDEIRGMTSNPMFTGLLCEYVRTGHAFPENTYSVFETYIRSRLTRDADRLQRRFHVKASEVRAIAEKVAFCMAADSVLGLSPRRQQITDSMQRLGFQVDERFDVFLDALEFIKLARSEATMTGAGEPRTFTFAHRRFQEYFATCVVLREPNQVTSTQLLTDARWRETAVVLFQTQPMQALTTLIFEAQGLLNQKIEEMPGDIKDPIEYFQMLEQARQSKQTAKAPPQMIPWPKGTLHLLSLLQDGFINKLNEVPEDMRQKIGYIVLKATTEGTLSDKKWALEVAGTVQPDILIQILRQAFGSRSQVWKDVAYKQASKLSHLPLDIARSIRHALVRLFLDGRLRHERYATQAHLLRLDNSKEFTAILRLLLWIPLVDLVLHILLFATVLAELLGSNSFLPQQGFLFVVAIMLSYLSTRAWKAYPQTNLMGAVIGLTLLYADLSLKILAKSRIS